MALSRLFFSFSLEHGGEFYCYSYGIYSYYYSVRVSICINTRYSLLPFTGTATKSFRNRIRVVFYICVSMQILAIDLVPSLYLCLNLYTLIIFCINVVGKKKLVQKKLPSQFI